MDAIASGDQSSARQQRLNRSFLEFAIERTSFGVRLNGFEF
jgi:hypothetical protein